MSELTICGVTQQGSTPSPIACVEWSEWWRFEFGVYQVDVWRYGSISEYLYQAEVMHPEIGGHDGMFAIYENFKGRRFERKQMVQVVEAFLRACVLELAKAVQLPEVPE